MRSTIDSRSKIGQIVSVAIGFGKTRPRRNESEEELSLLVQRASRHRIKSAHMFVYGSTQCLRLTTIIERNLNEWNIFIIIFFYFFYILRAAGESFIFISSLARFTQCTVTSPSMCLGIEVLLLISLSSFLHAKT